MMQKAWSSIEEVPYCFWRSSVKFQCHTAKKIIDFDPNWAFPDCNSSLNSLMAMKCCTKLETAKERCPIVCQDHPSNFKVTRDKTSPILTQIGRFRTIGRSQLSSPSDLPCLWFSLFILAITGHQIPLSANGLSLIQHQVIIYAGIDLLWIVLVRTNQCGKLNFLGTHPKTDVPYMFYTKFHSPGPIFYSPSLKCTCIGERVSISFPHCKHEWISIQIQRRDHVKHMHQTMPF